MIKKLLFCVLTIVVIAAKAQSPYPYVLPNIDWIKHYSQTDGISSAPTAIDANSNVYTTGYTGIAPASDILILKYDSTGVQQYAYPFNGGGFDMGNAIKVDASGNAFIAGITTATNGTTGRNYIIIKVNTAGAFQWGKTYDRGVSKDDEANDIAVDASGDLYITGRSKNSSNNFDIVTIKLSGSTGNQIWSHIYTGSGLDDVGTGIVVSPNGSYVYVTGNTDNSTTGTNIVTYALNASSGASYWSPVVTNGSANTTDKSNGIITLGSDIVVCGEKNNSTTGLDYTTIKYSGSTGTILWQNSYDVSNASNRATALVRDSSGNVGVVGTVLNGSIYEYHTVLYSSSGTQYAVNIESTGLSTITVDPSICNDTIAHHWYVSGEKQMSTKDIFVYQIVPSGNTSWRQYIDGQNNNIDAGTAVAVNGIGVVFVSGLSKNSSANYDYTTVKISQTPAYPPIDNLNQTPNAKYLFYRNIGQIKKTSGVRADSVLAYFDKTYPEWYFNRNSFSFVHSKIDTVASTTDSTHRVEITYGGSNPLAPTYFLDEDVNNNVLNYYTDATQNFEKIKGSKRIFTPNIYHLIDLHHTSNKDGLKTYFVIKPSASYSTIRLNINGAISSTLNAGKLEIKTSLGKYSFNAPVIYQVDQTLSFTVVPSAAWRLTGNVATFTCGAYNPLLPLCIMVSNANTSAATTAAHIQNIDWSTFYGGSSTDNFSEFANDQNGNLYAVGATQSSDFPILGSNAISYAGGGDAMLVKFNKYGVRRWATYYGVASTYQRGENIAIDNANRIYMSGITDGNVVYPTTQPSGAFVDNTFNGDNDIYVTRFDTVGALNWATLYGGPDYEQVLRYENRQSTKCIPCWLPSVLYKLSFSE